MITPYERDLLRARALDAWNQAKRLHRDTAWLIERSRTLRDRRAATRRTGERVAPQRTGEVAEGMWGTYGANVVEDLVDRVLARPDPRGPDVAADGDAVALVASAEMAELLRFGDLLRSCTPYVVGASDAGTALGLLIGTQPDLAVIDDHLELSSGADLTVTLSLYAPRTAALLLCDDPDTASRMQTAGVVVRSHDISESDLRRWAAAALA